MERTDRTDRRELLSCAGLGAGALILGGVAVDPVAAQRPGRLDEKNRGYGIVEATQQELRVQFKAVDAMQRRSAARTIGSFRVPSGTPRVEVV